MYHVIYVSILVCINSCLLIQKLNGFDKDSACVYFQNIGRENSVIIFGLGFLTVSESNVYVPV